MCRVTTGILSSIGVGTSILAKMDNMCIDNTDLTNAPQMSTIDFDNETGQQVLTAQEACWSECLLREIVVQLTHVLAVPAAEALRAGKEKTKSHGRLLLTFMVRLEVRTGTLQEVASCGTTLRAAGTQRTIIVLG